MNKSKHQLERLLRGAAAARRSTQSQSVEAPNTEWLIARTQRRDQISPGVFVVLRRGLATACLLLLATGIVAAREIRQQQSDVVNLAVSAPLEIAGGLVP